MNVIVHINGGGGGGGVTCERFSIFKFPWFGWTRGTDMLFAPPENFEHLYM